MLSRRYYFRLMLGITTLLALLGVIPRLVRNEYVNMTDAALQFGLQFLVGAAVVLLNYRLVYRTRLMGQPAAAVGWPRRLGRVGITTLLAGTLAVIAGSIHARLLPPLLADGLLVIYYIRGQFYVIAVALVQSSIDFFEQAQRMSLHNERLQREQLLARYEVLKQQVSPHFLFNSLTTLGWLIRDQPAAAERFVEEMSLVYRYVLQHGEQEQVTLRSELDFTLSYVYLLHMRFGDNLRLQVELPAWTNQLYVPPLALQTLVENAVKHNVVSQSCPLTVTIAFTEPNRLTVRNNRQPRLSPEPSSGLGLRNLSNRLRFLHETDLFIEQDDTSFTVLLPLATPGRSRS